MRILCVAEKNSIAKAVAGILAGGRLSTENTSYKYVKNYKFSFEFPQFGLCDVVMTSVAGHLSSYDFAEGYGWGRCAHSELFRAPIEVKLSADQAKIAKNIETLSRRCDRLMIWTDCDREGEAIGQEILDVARRGNPGFSLENTLRAQFSHLESSHVVHAARHPVRLDRGAIHAVQTRSEIDLRGGVAFTRLLTSDVFGKYTASKTLQVVSYGTCQFPTLGFVVDRYRRVRGFTPEQFWYLEVTTRKDNLQTRYSWARNRLFDRMSCAILFDKCSASSEATITSIKTAPTSKWRPLPLTTVELQKCCAIYFKMSARDSLAAAESLYQKGIISYPRTETDRYPDQMDLRGLVAKQTHSSDWGQYASTLLNDETRFCAPRAGSHDDKAHPPIHPIIHHGMDGFRQAEKKVYEFIVRHFLATVSNDARGSKTSVELQWGPEKFTASGLTVLETNFLDIYPWQTWKTTTAIPKFELHEKIKLTSANMKSGKTSPPKHMTEPELIALMDANGIGTDATIAEHIEKIKTREYIIEQEHEKNKKILLPTPLGISLVEGFDKISLPKSLTKPFFRRDMELNLKAICDGVKTKDSVTTEFIAHFSDSFNRCAANKSVILQTYERYNDLVNR